MVEASIRLSTLVSVKCADAFASFQTKCGEWSARTISSFKRTDATGSNAESGFLRRAAGFCLKALAFTSFFVEVRA
jgi:hypothetical protein